MKFNFKKISAIATSVLMTGMTIGAAMITAANLQGYSVVSGEKGSHSDSTQASNLYEEFKGGASAGSSDLKGENFKLEKDNTKFDLVNSVYGLPYTSLDKEDLKDLLAEFVYRDKNRTDYKKVQQYIELADHEIEMIKDKKYDSNNPTLGIEIPKGGKVFDYTIEFTDGNPELDSMKDSKITLLGKEYYIYDADNTAITLLDSSASQTITETEKDKKISIGGVEYTVSVTVYDRDNVRFTVNGETTRGMKEGSSEKLNDGSYLVVSGVSYGNKESVISEVDFSIGKGEIYLPRNGGNVRVNDEKVDTLKSEYTLVGEDKQLDTLTLMWSADKKTYLTGAKDYQKGTFPVFGGVEYVFNGMTFPSDYEKFEIVPGDSHLEYRTEIESGHLDLPVVYLNDGKNVVEGYGEDANSLLKVNDTCSNVVTFEIDLENNEVENYFVVSYIKGEKGYTYAYMVDRIDDDDGIVLKGMAGESDITLKARKISRKELDFEGKIINATRGTATVEVSTAVANGKVCGDRVVSKSGLVVELPKEGILDQDNGDTTIFEQTVNGGT